MQTSAEETSLLQKHHLRSRDKVQQRSGGQWCYIKLLNLPLKEIHSPNSLTVADGTGLNVFSPTERETCSTPERCLFSFICNIFSPLFPFFVRLPAVFSFSNARSPLSRSVLFSLLSVQIFRELLSADKRTRFFSPPLPVCLSQRGPGRGLPFFIRMPALAPALYKGSSSSLSASMGTDQ